MKAEKKIVATTLAAGLALSSFTIALPVQNQLVAKSVAQAAETHFAESYVNQVIAAYATLTPQELTDVRAVRDAVSSKEWTWWEGTVINDNEFDSKIAQLYSTDETPVYNMVRDFVQLFYTADDLQATADTFKATHTETFKTLFGTDFTLNDLMNFASDLQQAAASNFFINSIFNENYTVDNAITDAINDTFNTGNYEVFKGKLQALGLSVSDLITIKDNFQSTLQAENVPVIAARNAVIGGFARANSQIVLENNTPTVGSTQQLKYRVTYPTMITLEGGVDYYSSNPEVATVTIDGAFSAVAEGTTTITVQAKGIVVGSKEVTVSAAGGGGTIGGGIVIGGETETPADTVETEATVTTTTDSTTGQTIANATINEDKALEQIEQSTKAIDVQVKVEETADVAKVNISADFVSKVAEKNANNTISVVSTLGTTTILVKDVSTLLAQLKADGENVAVAKVEVSFGKATSTDSESLNGSVTAEGAKALTGAFITVANVTIGDRVYPVQNFKNYLKSTFTIDHTVDTKNVIGVQWNQEENTSAKSTVKASALRGEMSAVPTIIQVKDGKTQVVVKQRTSAPVMVVENSKSFKDVGNSFWGKADIDLLASKMIIKGKTKDEFKPFDQLTRAEYAAMIVRAIGLNKSLTTEFPDVATSDWYAGYVGAASQAGIITGNGDGTFKPNDKISREAAAAMIVRAIEFLGGEITLTDAEKSEQLAKFTDAKTINNWAVEYVAKNVKVGIIQGKGDKSFSPLTDANRAESATMLKRFMKQMNLISE
ncbi:MAG: S-layer homology domain-containing protein [Tepidibacillus sp.]